MSFDGDLHMIFWSDPPNLAFPKNEHIFGTHPKVQFITLITLITKLGFPKLRA